MHTQVSDQLVTSQFSHAYTYTHTHTHTHTQTHTHNLRMHTTHRGTH